MSRLWAERRSGVEPSGRHDDCRVWQPCDVISCPVRRRRIYYRI